MFTEKVFDVKPLDKIFCSQWLDNESVLVGSKCNQLRRINTNNNNVEVVEVLESCKTDNKPPKDSSSGIYTMAVNPSRTLLATAARNPNDTAVFRLPSLEAVCVGQQAHTEIIFDIKWLDDTHYVSGSKDETIALWKVEDDMITKNTDEADDNKKKSSYDYMTAENTFSCGAKVRSMTFLEQEKTLISLTTSARVQAWDTETFSMLFDVCLLGQTETNCVASHGRLIAVGSKDNIYFLDKISLQTIRIMKLRQKDSSVRSLSFNGNILTIGTGQCELLFIDCRTFNYVSICDLSATFQNMATKIVTKIYDRGETEKTYLPCGLDYIRPVDDFLAERYNPAVFTHCYDPSGKKLFAAGGPLSAGMSGSYAAVHSKNTEFI